MIRALFHLLKATLQLKCALNACYRSQSTVEVARRYEQALYALEGDAARTQSLVNQLHSDCQHYRDQALLQKLFARIQRFLEGVERLKAYSLAR